MYNMHALFFKFRHCVSRIEGLTDTPREWQQKSGDETGVFGVDGGELTAVVGGKAAHVHVRDFFQLEPETKRREGGRVQRWEYKKKCVCGSLGGERLCRGKAYKASISV